MVEQHLGLAQEKHAIRPECEAKPVDHPSWVSALRYISVLRHSRMSMREIGASLVRSFLPKITLRRRSGVTT